MTMKKFCKHCGQWKEEEEFHNKVNGEKQLECKECHREIDRRSYERRKARGDILGRSDYIDSFKVGKYKYL